MTAGATRSFYLHRHSEQSEEPACRQAGPRGISNLLSRGDLPALLPAGKPTGRQRSAFFFGRDRGDCRSNLVILTLNSSNGEEFYPHTTDGKRIPRRSSRHPDLPQGEKDPHGTGNLLSRRDPSSSELLRMTGGWNSSREESSRSPSF